VWLRSEERENAVSTCPEHNKLVREQTELNILFRAHAETTSQNLTRILNLLQGQGGADGLTDRATRLEAHLTNFMTQTDEYLERLVTAIQGKDGNSGLVSRMGKLERGWAMFIGVAIASGVAGAGFAKLIGLVGN